MKRCVMNKESSCAAESGKKARIRSMFDRIAPSYDRLNHLLSFGIDHGWRRRATRRVAAAAPAAILDLAAGTGDWSLLLARRFPEARITGVDLSSEMLAAARRKAERCGAADRIRFEEGDAERLAAADGTFDLVTVGFGVRNFTRLEQCLREMHRVLRTGGTLAVLELSTPRNPLWRALYEFYAFRLLPLVGGAVSGDRGAYRYLPASVRAFHRPERFAELLREAGFRSVERESFSGGIATLYIAKR